MTRPVLRLTANGGLGDVVLMTPMFRAWKQANPTGRLVVYCLGAGHREVLRNNPYIDSLKVLSKLRMALSGFALVRPKTLMTPFYGWLAPSFFHQEHASRLIGGMHGIKVGEVRPEIFLTKAEQEGGRARLAPFRTPVVIHTIGFCSENKQWIPEHWQQLIERCPDYDFVQIGAPHEPLVPGARDLRGLQLRESFSVISQARAFIGVDSCPAHAAAAFDVPKIVLFGPSVPHVWGHANANNLYVRQRCSPCIDTLAGGSCPYGRRCMRAISVQMVKEALDGILAAPAAPRELSTAAA